MNYDRGQNDFMGLYAPNLIYHSIFTPPIKLEPTFIQNQSSDDSYNEDTSTTMVNSPCPSTYTSMVNLSKYVLLLLQITHFRISLTMT